ncbi:MAG: fructosamine kinase family protein [Planctomycetota bacterium]
MASGRERIAAALGTEIEPLERLAGGCIADVVATTTRHHGPIVAKLAGSDGTLDVEAGMLRDLAVRAPFLPNPEIYYADAGLLIMERLPGSTGIGIDAQPHLAELLAELHGVTAPKFGYPRDTLIGSLPQPNAAGSRPGCWADFFAEHRVRAFATRARTRGSISEAGLRTAHALADAIRSSPERYVAPGEDPVLIHGDLWSGNMLSDGGRVTGLIDPAIYFADREIELAFVTLFGCVGDAFFGRYGELRPIQPGFWEFRRDLYTIYPLLVHATLFGGGYGAQAEAAMARVLGRA